MAAIDELKSFRGKDYSSKKEDPTSEGEKNSTPRIISLTDDEKKAFEGSPPGSDLACEVHGTLEADGHFHVMSVSPLGGGSSYGDQGGDEKQMAGMVAQKVMPGI